MKEVNYKVDDSVDPIKFAERWLDYLHNNTIPLGEEAVYDPCSVIKYNMRQGVGIITDVSYQDYDDEATNATGVAITLATDDFDSKVDEIHKEILSIEEESKK
ncbi:MAG: hypothetical protein KAT77_02750 [Nanoarchaeota archaeon]|nr:hypothetical protein [Nanoarchaeota archaeon]